MGIKGRRLNSYPGSFKQSAIDEVLIDKMGLRETARKYGVTHKMIQTWIKLYHEKGSDYFFEKPLGNPLIHDSHVQVHAAKIQSPKKLKKKALTEEDIPLSVKTELDFLRMENAYLKKLNALVRTREQLETRKKRK